MKTLRKILSIAGTVLVLGGAALAADAAPTEHIVFPTGVFPIDVSNIQAAVNLGGTVLLRATNRAGLPTPFNFGETADFGQGVIITNEVALLGETRAGAQTTIQWGKQPILCQGDFRTRISGIHFLNPAAETIVYTKSAGAEVTANRISGLRPHYYLNQDFSEARGIMFVDSSASGRIHGEICVNNNVIEGGPADYSDAILCEGVTGTVEIRGNHIESTPGEGILVYLSGATFEISENFIKPGQTGLLGANGIYIGGAVGIRLCIAHNRILCENSTATGIVLQADSEFDGPIDRPQIGDNDISVVDSAYGAIGFSGMVNRANVVRNKITGSGAFALAIFDDGDPADVAADNDFTGNDLSGYQSSLADVFLDDNTRCTLVVGAVGTVEDLGVGNKFRSH